MADNSDEKNLKNKSKKKTKSPEKSTKNLRWIIQILLISVVISAIFSLLSTKILEDAGYWVAFLVLATFIMLGIVFDVIGVAVTVADERPFHSMAAHKEPGASAAIHLIRNANRVSSICNDVVGDISGIVSGTTAAIIVVHLSGNFAMDSVILSVVISAVVSGLTIGGKAIGKMLALSRSTEIVFAFAKIYRFAYKH